MNYVCGYSPPLINVVRHKIIFSSVKHKILSCLFSKLNGILVFLLMFAG